MMRKHPANQLLGDLSKVQSSRNWGIEGDGAGDQPKVGKADADRHSPTRPVFGSQTGGNPVRKMTQCGHYNPLFSRLLAES